MMSRTNTVSGVRLVLGYSGVIIMIIGAIVMLPLLFLLPYPEERDVAKFFIVPGVCTLMVGYLFSFFVRGHGKGHVDKGQSAVIVVTSWVVAVFSCAIPFYLTGDYTMTQAVFESTSGWTTTGLTVVDVENTPHLFLIHRSLTMFFGGIGLVLVTLSVLPNSYGMSLYRAEGHSDNMLPNLLRSSRIILILYSGYIIGGILLYVAFGMPWFDALNHSICAVATGGFSTKALSIGFYHSVPIEMVSVILMILGSTNFLAHLCFLSGKPKRFFAHCEMHLTMLIYAVSVPLATYFLISQVGETFFDSFRSAAFHMISALSTTGYQIVPAFNGWPSTLLLLLTLLMLVGGHAGSTAGGIKQVRVYIMLKSLIWYFRDTLSSGRIVRADHIQKPTEKQLVTAEMKNETFIFLQVYLLVFLAGSFFLCMKGFDLKHALFEYASAMGGVGLSAGVTSPDAAPPVLWALSLGMFVGRLEIFVVITAFLKLLRSMLALGTEDIS